MSSHCWSMYAFLAEVQPHLPAPLQQPLYSLQLVKNRITITLTPISQNFKHFAPPTDIVRTKTAPSTKQWRTLSRTSPFSRHPFKVRRAPPKMNDSDPNSWNLRRRIHWPKTEHATCSWTILVLWWTWLNSILAKVMVFQRRMNLIVYSVSLVCLHLRRPVLYLDNYVCFVNRCIRCMTSQVWAVSENRFNYKNGNYRCTHK